MFFSFHANQLQSLISLSGIEGTRIKLFLEIVDNRRRFLGFLKALQRVSLLTRHQKRGQTDGDSRRTLIGGDAFFRNVTRV